MPRYLMMRLEGPMQAWGTHTYEDYRPSNLFPTRSGLLGLIGACMGIDRHDRENLEGLAASVRFTVRVDECDGKTSLRLRDYHTVVEARRANRAPKTGETIQTWREYLFDASFTIAISATDDASQSLVDVANALRRPLYTPSLGRRSCPITRPLFAGWQEAEDACTALAIFHPMPGLIYDEIEVAEGAPLSRPMSLRDVPTVGRQRAFGTRTVWLRGKGK